MSATIWTAIASSAAAISIILTLYQINELKKTFRTQIFSEILKELGEEQVRLDRSIITNIENSNMPTINSMKEKIYKNNKENDKAIYLSPELAINRTIPRLDRVGYYILGDNNKLVMNDPPAWLWDIIEKTWRYSYFWINHRKSPDSGEYYQKNYGRYFERLHKYYQVNKDTIAKVYSESDYHFSDC